MTVESIIFPKEWSSFLITTEIGWQESFEWEFCPQIPCLYDAAHLQGHIIFKPWEDSAKTVPEVLENWEKLKIELHEKFSLRDTKAALEPMKIGVGLFLETLYWTHSTPIRWKMNEEVLLNSKPVNWEERLEFILAYPNKYHSYIQLTELFSEMEKIFVKQQIVKK